MSTRRTWPGEHIFKALLGFARVDLSGPRAPRYVPYDWMFCPICGAKRPKPQQRKKGRSR